jgi:hypothetical protein
MDRTLVAEQVTLLGADSATALARMSKKMNRRPGPPL